MKYLASLFICLILVGCDHYEDHRQEIEEYIKDSTPDLTNVKCASDRLIPYAEEFCSHHLSLDKEDKEAFIKCFKKDSFLGLEHSFYKLNMSLCKLKEALDQLNKRAETLD